MLGGADFVYFHCFLFIIIFPMFSHFVFIVSFFLVFLIFPYVFLVVFMCEIVHVLVVCLNVFLCFLIFSDCSTFAGPAQIVTNILMIVSG